VSILAPTRQAMRIPAPIKRVWPNDFEAAAARAPARFGARSAPGLSRNKMVKANAPLL
jgi:hypothetical protein